MNTVYFQRLNQTTLRIKMSNNFEENLYKLGEQELYMVCREKMEELHVGSDCIVCNGNGSYADYDDFRDIRFLAPCFCLLEAIDKV